MTGEQALEIHEEVSRVSEQLRDGDMMTRSRQRFLLAQKFADALKAECPDAENKYAKLFRMLNVV